MKKNLLFLFLVFVSANALYSQIVAGNTASGLIISNPAVSLTVAAIYGSDSKTFDLDCDSIADMRIDLYKGPTAIDGSNNAFLYIINPAFQVCADTLNSSFRFVNYFNLSDTITPPTDTNWYNDSIMQLGNYGCMDCYGPFSTTDLYLGYKNTTTSQIGWIKISFNLIDGGASVVPITLSVPEVLSPCVTTSISPVPTSTSTPTYTGFGIATCSTFTYNYTIYSPSCSGMCDGGVFITNMTGGTPAYNYVWSTAAPQVGPAVSGLCNGTYSFIITDAVGNTCTSNFLVSDPAPMTFSLSSTNASCYGAANGSICCTNLIGGPAPYIFSCNPGFSSGMSCVNNIPAGYYNFCVTNANGCQVCHTVTLTEPNSILVSESITQASCASCCDGSSQLQISGGVPPYVTVYTNTPSCPGNYGYAITDANGCVFTDSVLITYPTSLSDHNFEPVFDVFPNPSKGNFEIRNLNTDISNMKIRVLDVYGKTVFSKTTELKDQTLPLNLNVADGIYFLHIMESLDSKEFVKKIVILH